MSPRSDAARRLIRGLDGVINIVACALVVALLAAVTVGIVTRALDDPLSWTDELARFLMAWLAMVGWIVASRRKGHVRIRYFQGLLPPMGWRATEFVIQLGMAALGLIVAYFGAMLVRRNIDLDATSLPVSMCWLYVPLVPAGVVTFFQAGAELAALIRCGQRPTRQRLVE